MFILIAVLSKIIAPASCVLNQGEHPAQRRSAGTRQSRGSPTSVHAGGPPSVHDPGSVPRPQLG